MNSNLKYIKHAEVDAEKWDSCVIEASNSRIYALSWFLDRTAEVWDALVWGNYEYVMPLPIGKKFLIRYVYQPLFCQQLGIFPSPPAEIIRSFLDELMQRFHYINIQMNSANLITKDIKDLQLLRRQNFLFHLDGDYPVIKDGYTTNTRRNIEKATSSQLFFTTGIPMEVYISFKEQNMAAKISRSGMRKLKSIMAHSLYKGIGEIAGVYTSENNLCAAVFFCRWKERIIYMNAVSSKEGKEMRAMFYLIDRFIYSAAGSNIALDFEGSMIPGIARFFEGFGAAPEAYFHVKYNRLPAFINWIKRGNL
jgi:hypothetical protein